MGEVINANFNYKEDVENFVLQEQKVVISSVTDPLKEFSPVFVETGRLCIVGGKTISYVEGVSMDKSIDDIIYTIEDLHGEVEQLASTDREYFLERKQELIDTLEGLVRRIEDE